MTLTYHTWHLTLYPSIKSSTLSLITTWLLLICCVCKLNPLRSASKFLLYCWLRNIHFSRWTSVVDWLIHLIFPSTGMPILCTVSKTQTQLVYMDGCWVAVAQCQHVGFWPAITSLLASGGRFWRASLFSSLTIESLIGRCVASLLRHRNGVAKTHYTACVLVQYVRVFCLYVHILRCKVPLFQ